jgi:hypothetical protein
MCISQRLLASTFGSCWFLIIIRGGEIVRAGVAEPLGLAEVWVFTPGSLLWCHFGRCLSIICRFFYFLFVDRERGCVCVRRPIAFRLFIFRVGLHYNEAL